MELNDEDLRNDKVKDRLLLILTVVLFVIGTFFVFQGLKESGVGRIKIGNDNEAQVIQGQLVKTIDTIRKDLDELESSLQ